VEYDLNSGFVSALRDPTGSRLLCAAPDEPVAAQSMIVNGQNVAGISQRFVKLLDLQEANDRVSWRALYDWVASDNVTVLEEEQTVTVHAVDSPDRYRIDVDGIARAGDKGVRFPGGAIQGPRLISPDAPVFLNANGDTGPAARQKPAAWNDESRSTPSGQIAGFATVFRRTSAWGGEWSIDAHTERTFRYRVIVHTGPPDALRLNQEFQEFAGTAASAATQPAPSYK